MNSFVPTRINKRFITIIILTRLGHNPINQQILHILYNVTYKSTFIITQQSSLLQKCHFELYNIDTRTPV